MKMNSLLGKILLALLTSTLLALLVVSLIQRSILKRGFNDFLEQQEEVQLSYLVPELQDWYQRKGSWEDIKGDSRTWLRLLARTRPEGVRPPEDADLDERPRPFKAGREGDRSNDRRMGNPPAPELRQLWRRLFLLDAERRWVAGKRGGETGAGSIQEIRVGEAVVGWVGFISAHGPPAPEARRYLQFQRNSLLVSALIALLASALLGYWLARSISRPVTALRDSVQGLTDGDYSVRNEVRGSDEIATLGRQVNRLAKTLQANESARRRWTADIAHELRTPITILQGELEAARDGVRPNTAATMDSLREEVLHLSRLVDDLQTLALADAGALNLKLEETDVAAVLRQVLDSLQERLRQAGLTLHSTLPEKLVIHADGQKLRQLLLNLLENSCRYTDSGGSIGVTLVASPTGLELNIEDSAPGLNADQCAQVLERFYRAESSRGRAGGGSGLGLAICREIVQAHGGDISVAPGTLGGLAIRIHLPDGV